MLSIAGLIIALAIVVSMLLSQPQLQATTPSDEQNQVTEEKVLPQDKATATITITMTAIGNNNETEPNTKDKS